MKKLWIYYLTAIVFAFGLVSCSDDDDNSTTPSTKDSTSTSGNSSYWNMKVGTYWIYGSYLVDSTGAQTGNNLLTDSTVVVSTSTINSKTAFTVNLFNATTGIKTSDGYSFAPEKTALYVTSDFITPIVQQIPLISSYLTIPDYGWLKVADNSVTSWDLLPEAIHIKDLPVNVSMANLTVDPVSLDITVAMTKNGTGTMTDPVTGKTVNTLSFKLDYKIAGTASATYMGLVKLAPALEGHIYSYITFAEGIGLVANYYPTQNFKIAATLPAPLSQTMDLYSQKLQGNGTFMIRYKN